MRPPPHILPMPAPQLRQIPPHQLRIAALGQALRLLHLWLDATLQRADPLCEGHNGRAVLLLAARAGGAVLDEVVHGGAFLVAELVGEDIAPPGADGRGVGESGCTEAVGAEGGEVDGDQGGDVGEGCWENFEGHFFLSRGCSFGR